VPETCEVTDRMSLSMRIQTAVWRVEDFLRHSSHVRNLNAIFLVARAYASNVEAVAARHLSRALAFSENPALSRRITASIMKRFPPEFTQGTWRQVVEDIPNYRKILESDPQLTRSILLKAPGLNGEKGVLLLYFEYNWIRLICGLSDSEFDWFNHHFDVILSTSWSPTDYAALALFLGKTTGAVFVQPCNHAEREKLEGLHPRIVALDSMPCDWINPAFYTKKDQERPIDFLMVANWGGFKRHIDFFEALRYLPKKLRVVLVGQKEAGRDSEYIINLAKRLGVPQALEVHQSIPIEKVSELQEEAKVSLIFSRREGCCVAAVESLFAGCALGMRSDAHVGPLDYINEKTGLRLRPGHIAEDLRRLLEISGSFDPSSWAAGEVSCHITHQKLNQSMEEAAQVGGRPWTRDLVLPQWRPYPQYVNMEDAEEMRPAYEELHERSPRVFPRSGDWTAK